MFTSKCPFEVQISQGLGPFSQIELSKTGRRRSSDRWGPGEVTGTSGTEGRGECSDASRANALSRNSLRISICSTIPRWKSNVQQLRRDLLLACSSKNAVTLTEAGGSSQDTAGPHDNIIQYDITQHNMT